MVLQAAMCAQYHPNTAFSDPDNLRNKRDDKKRNRRGQWYNRGR